MKNENSETADNQRQNATKIAWNGFGINFNLNFNNQCKCKIHFDYFQLEREERERMKNLACVWISWISENCIATLQISKLIGHGHFVILVF